MKKQLPAWLVLFIISLVAGLMLAGTNELTKDRIHEQSLAAANAARETVMSEADGFEQVHPDDANSGLDNCYKATKGGETIGYVGQITVKGYGGDIEVVAGVDTTGLITGVSVGGSGFSETAGLGAKTKESKFTGQFAGKTVPLRLKENVDSVTGASISSGAVVGGVNKIASHIIEDELGIVDEEAEEPVWVEERSITVKGFGGDVDVIVRFGMDGSIADVEVVAPNETEGLGKLTQEDYFTEQFKGKTGDIEFSDDGVDSIAGATVTSTAVLDGVNELIDEGEVKIPVLKSAKAKGFGGDVEVRAIFNSRNQLVYLNVLAPNETEGLGKMAEDEDFSKQFLGKTGPFDYADEELDALSGATITSNAVLEALNSLCPEGESEKATPDEKPVATEEPEAEATAEPEPEAKAEPEAVPATDALTATAKGFGGDVEVTATANEDGSIATLVIKAPSETAGLGLKAEEPDFAEQFIGKSAPFAYGDGIDAVTGATITSNAVLEALNGLFANEDEAATEPEVKAGAEPEVKAEPETTVEPEPEAKPKSETSAEKSAPEAAPVETAPATDALVATAKGFGGDVEVTATANEDGSIATLVIKAPSETAGLGLKAEEPDFAEQFIGKSAPFAYGDGIDAVTGATITSNAVLEALNGLFAK